MATLRSGRARSRVAWLIAAAAAVAALFANSTAAWATPTTPSQPTSSQPATSQPQPATSHPAPLQPPKPQTAKPQTTPQTTTAKPSQQYASASELNQLRQLVEELSRQIEAKQSASPKKLSIYGFFDVGFLFYQIEGEPAGSRFISESATFVLGNFNVYFDARPFRDWRFLGEVRFSLYPSGKDLSLTNPATGDTYQRVDVSVNDFGQFGSTFNWGTIEVERAQLEWSRYRWLQLTAGLFLTPIGIWNVDHGSPTRLTAQMPYLYVGHSSTARGAANVGALIPERQLGLMAHGTATWGPTTWGYNLYISNGRGPAAELVDFDDEKAIGARIATEYDEAFRLKVGLSGYANWVEDKHKTIQFSPRFDVTESLAADYFEYTLATDLQLSLGPISLMAEAMVNSVTFKGTRPTVRDPSTGEEGAAPDVVRWGTYGILSYRLPRSLAALRAYAMVGWVGLDSNTPNQSILECAFGLNWSIRPGVVFKAEYHLWSWPNADAQNLSLWTGLGTMHGLVSQLAVAF